MPIIDSCEPQKAPNNSRAYSSKFSIDWRHVALLVSAISAYAFKVFTSKPSVHVILPDTYALCTPDGENVYTVSDANPRAKCLVVHESLFSDVGSLEQVRKRWASVHGHDVALPVRYSPAGSIIVPGLSDAHAHILEYGGGRQLNLEGTLNVEDTVKRVREYILSNQDVYNNDSTLIFGSGWNHMSWPSQTWPTAKDLDSDPVIRGRPVILHSKDYHAVWTSSEGLKPSLPLPDAVPGGVIIRDTSGNPTGTLLDNAQELLNMPPLTQDELKRRFIVTCKDALSVGLTSIHDAGLTATSLDFFKRQSESGDLPIRIYGMSYYEENGPYWGNTTSPLISTGRSRLSARSVKIFADGALRTGGSALYEPYNDAPESSGFMRIPEATLQAIIPKFLRDGWQVNVHAIGDRANGIVLDAFEMASADVDLRALRPRLEHAQIMTQSDIKRVGKLGILASVQPTHAVSDMWYAEGRIGRRVEGLYAFRSLLANGAILALGSDFPVENMNPLAGFHAAVTRLSPEGTSPHGPGGWFPLQRLTREEALKGITTGPAYASFTESSLGSIEVGKRADFVILSQDIMTIPQEHILDTKVLVTAIDGAYVYESP